MARLLHWISLACCAFVVVSFVLFAHTQVSGASVHQVNAVAGTTGTPAASARPVTQPRRFIDTVAGDLTSPFSGVVGSSNPWVRHLVPLSLALLVYGLGIGYLARWANGRAT